MTKTKFFNWFKKDRIKFLLIFVVGALFVYLTREVHTHKQNAEMYAQLNQSLTDSLCYHKDSLGRAVYRISALEVRNEQAFKDLIVKDSTIKKLQAAVDAYTKQISIINSTTSANKNFKFDSNNLFSEPKEYLFDFDGWIKAKLKVTPPEDMNLGVEVISELRIVHKVDPEDGRMYVEVSDANPYVKTHSLRSYYRINYLADQKQKSDTPTSKVSEILNEASKIPGSILGGSTNFGVTSKNSKTSKKRWGIGPYVGYGFGFDGKSQKTVLSPAAGIGVQYSVIRF